MKTLLKVLTLSLVLLVLSSPAVAEYKFKVGVSLPLTGPVAEYGEATRNGIELAAEQDPGSFKDISFLYENNEFNAAKSVTAFNKLSRIDKVDLVYNWGEPALHAIAPLAKATNTPVLAMSLDPRPARGHKHIVRSINHSDEYASAMLRHLDAQGNKRIALVSADDPFFTSLIESYEKHLLPGQEITHIERVLPDEHDFRSLMIRLNQQNYDAVGVLLFPGQVSTFFKLASQMKLPGVKFGTDIFESKTEIKDANGTMNSSLYPNIIVPEAFAKQYQARFENINQLAYAYNAYCMAKLLAKRFGGLKASPGSEAILRTLEDGKDSSSFLSTSSERGGNYYQFEIAIMQVEGSGFGRYS